MKALVLAFSMIATASLAQERPANPEPTMPKLPSETQQKVSGDGATGMIVKTLTLPQLLDLMAGLGELDGRPDPQPAADPPGDPKPPHRTPYQLAGAAILAQARDMAALTALYQSEQQAEVKVNKEYDEAVDKKLPPPPGQGWYPCFQLDEPKKRECAKRIQELREAEQPATLFSINAKDLNVEKNQMPGSVISRIVPILNFQ